MIGMRAPVCPAKSVTARWGNMATDTDGLGGTAPASTLRRGDWPMRQRAGTGILASCTGWEEGVVGGPRYLPCGESSPSPPSSTAQLASYKTLAWRTSAGDGRVALGKGPFAPDELQKMVWTARLLTGSELVLTAAHETNFPARLAG